MNVAGGGIQIVFGRQNMLCILERITLEGISFFGIVKQDCNRANVVTTCADDQNYLLSQFHQIDLSPHTSLILENNE